MAYAYQKASWLVPAVFLLGISIAAITSMIFHIGPFE